MLYWICPECGGECSPAIRECPACAGTPAISPASAGPVHHRPAVTAEVLALAQNLQPAALTALPTPTLPPPASAGTNGLASGHGHSAQTATLEAAETPIEAQFEEALPAPPQEALESLVRPLIESTLVAPPPEPTLAETAPAKAQIEKAPAPAQPEPAPLAPQALCDAMALQAQLVLDSMAQTNSPEHSAIRGIVNSFQQQPKTSLLAPASEVVTAPAPPCLQWMRIPRPRLLPVPPKGLNPADQLSGLQTPPLAGPVIPRELRNLTERHSAARGRARKKAGLPAWTVSFLVAITLFLGVGSLLQYLAANRDEKASATKSRPTDQSSSAVPAGEQPSSKLVEVTGLRVAAGPNQKPQLEFIVVNHSATELSNVGLKIAVRSASSPSGIAPLFRVSTTIPSLGPYQSREFRAELDAGSHATEIPDWQSLRADVRINTQ